MYVYIYFHTNTVRAISMQVGLQNREGRLAVSQCMQTQLSSLKLPAQKAN